MAQQSGSRYEVRWSSYGSHGAQSGGVVGVYDTLEAARSARDQSLAEFEVACERQPLADTYFDVLPVDF